jgi:large subunit ribosomal protein L18
VFRTNVKIKKIAKDRIRKRIRKKIKGTEDRPRVFVFKSNRYLYLQAIDDESGKVLASATSLGKEFIAKNKNTKKHCRIYGSWRVDGPKAEKGKKGKDSL